MSTYCYEEIWLLIHVEVQAEPEDNFLRIFDFFRKPAISVAILCYQKRWKPSFGKSLNNLNRSEE